jgi:hypothetical protein
VNDDERAAYERTWMRPPIDRRLITTTPSPMGDTNRRSKPMQYTVHAGVKSASIPAIRSHLASLGLDLDSRGDGWNEWGESLGTSSNDVDTLHVSVDVTSLGEAIDLALNAYRMFEDDPSIGLVASNGAPEGTPFTEQQNHNLLIVSQDEDWAEQYLVIKDDGTATTLHRTVHI